MNEDEIKAFNGHGDIKCGGCGYERGVIYPADAKQVVCPHCGEIHELQESA